MGHIERNPFVNVNSSNMDQVLMQTAQAKDLSVAQKNERCSAMRSFAKWIGEPPTAIPAHPEYIRRKFNKLTPAAVGVSTKRFANVKSAPLAALRHQGLVAGQHYLAPLKPAWKALRQALPGKYAWTSLSRFFHYGSANGIEPSNVDDPISEAFLQALIDETLIKDPRVTHQNMCRAWNSMADTIPTWPKTKLTVPCYTDHYCLDWERFNPLLKEDHLGDQHPG